MTGVGKSGEIVNEIRIGDCRDIMKLLILGGVRVQTCVTSPPYFGLRDYGVADQIGLEATPEAYVAEMVEVFRLVRDLLTDDGTLWLNLGDTYAGSRCGPNNDGETGRHVVQSDVFIKSKLEGKRWGGGDVKCPGFKPKDLIGIPWRVAFALQAEGWYLRSDVIWHKPNPMPESVTDRPTKSHEYIFLLSKSSDYFYDSESISEEVDPANGRDSTTAPRSQPPGSSAHTGFLRGRRFEKRNKRSVWTVPTQPYTGAHFATFPPDLILPCILAGSRPGDTVFDPFMGSGTTALVAKENGRKYLGCELNPEYGGLQQQRLAQEVLFGV